MSVIFVLLCCFGAAFAGILDGNKVQSFDYEECEAPYSHPGLINLENFKLQTTRHGNFRVSGLVTLAVNLTSPVKAEFSMQHTIWGYDVPMVCVDNFGSCTYPNLCDLGVPSKTRCPKRLEKRGIPCRCPFEAGTYSIPGLVFPFFSTIAKTRLFGTHKGRVTISMKGTTLACYTFTLRME